MTERALHGEGLHRQGAPPRADAPLGRGRGDVGGIAVYLTSDASADHRGGTFVIDGGYRIF